MAYLTFVNLYLLINQVGSIEISVVDIHETVSDILRHVKSRYETHMLSFTLEKKCAMCVAKCFKVVLQLL
uniref:Uncharacterized protein n=1 Tax=Setaria viridis TaxID=4556 RepID=A0A4U6T9M9_SETVI|nr:hypothetical protein SEVIR_9G529701v2 [Setaria viridis]